MHTSTHTCNAKSIQISRNLRVPNHQSLQKPELIKTSYDKKGKIINYER